MWSLLQGGAPKVSIVIGVFLFLYGVSLSPGRRQDAEQLDMAIGGALIIVGVMFWSSGQMSIQPTADHQARPEWEDGKFADYEDYVEAIADWKVRKVLREGSRPFDWGAFWTPQKRSQAIRFGVALLLLAAMVVWALFTESRTSAPRTY